ncbi:hypothetical protein K443DRAFT_39123, partial [Laccaria amethystina LaAM-08-1]
TVDSLITHTPWWTAQGMGFQGVWAPRSGQTKAKQKNIIFSINFIRNQTNQTLISMGFSSKGVWVMGYCGCMGYKALFPVNQLGGLKNIWNLREYGVSEPWVTRESTVL